MANDTLFSNMDRLDALLTFKSYIMDLNENEKKINSESRKFMEYKNRENFREFLQEKVDNKVMFKYLLDDENYNTAETINPLIESFVKKKQDAKL